MTDLRSLNRDELVAMIETMRHRNEQRLSFKVSEKGAVAVYGLGRWPVTLYKSQMRRLLDASDDIRAFIDAHDSVLAVKAAA